jgi:hypothetical protein
MVKYENGKIYKIVCNVSGKIYYGSTAELNLSTRLAHHRSNYKRYLGGKGNFVSSFNIFENNDYDMVLVEKYPCNDKMELHARERFYIEENDCVNKVIPLRTYKEYYNDNAEIIKEKIKQYYCDNKEKIKLYRYKNVEKIKQYYCDNKEKIKRYNHHYYCDNAEKLKQNRKQYYKNKINCEN